MSQVSNRVVLPGGDASAVADMSALSMNGAPAGAAMPASYESGPQAHIQQAGPGAPPDINDAFHPDNEESVRLYVDFSASADQLMSPLNAHMKVFDVGSNARNIWSKPEGADLSRAIVTNVELLSVNNSFPFSSSISFKGPGAETLNTCGRANGQKVAVTMAPGESMRCSQQIYKPDSMIRGSHFKDYVRLGFYGLGFRVRFGSCSNRLHYRRIARRTAS
jgi:hypothetical protein